MKAFFKNLKKRDWILIAIFVLCLISYGIITLVSESRIEKLYDQQAGKAWIPEGNSGAMVSLLVSEDAKIDYMKFGSLKKTISKDIVSSKGIDPSTIDPADPFPGGFTGCYSAQGQITLEAGDVKADNLSAIGVGGDFFLFHPIELATGGYFYEDDIMKDGLVLDSYTAFRLFGSFNIIGQKVMIKGNPFYVRGVYIVDESRVSQYAGSAGGFLFMDYEALAKLGSVGSITCLEFVGEDIYDEYFYQLLSDNTKTHLDEKMVDVVDNTHRFDLAHRWTVLTDGDARVMKKNNIVYPYWENIARAYENRMAGVLVAQIILLMIPSIILIGFLIHIFKHRKWSFKSIEKRIGSGFESAAGHIKHNDDKGQNKWKDF